MSCSGKRKQHFGETAGVHFSCSLQILETSQGIGSDASKNCPLEQPLIWKGREQGRGRGIIIQEQTLIPSVLPAVIKVDGISQCIYLYT